MNIVHISDDIKKEFKVTSDGLTSVSIRGVARIAGVSETALRNNLKFKGANLSPSKMAKMLIENGFKGANFSNFSKFGIPDIALGIILQYYTFEAEENCNEQAKLAYQSFAVIGIRTWIQSELGYQAKGATMFDLTYNQLEQLLLYDESVDEDKVNVPGFFPQLNIEKLRVGVSPQYWDMPRQVILYLMALITRSVLERTLEVKVAKQSIQRSLEIFGTQRPPKSVGAKEAALYTHLHQQDVDELTQNLSFAIDIASDNRYVEAATCYQQRKQKIGGLGSMPVLDR